QNIFTRHGHLCAFLYVVREYKQPPTTKITLYKFAGDVCAEYFREFRGISPVDALWCDSLRCSIKTDMALETGGKAGRMPFHSPARLVQKIADAG
ncbi:hypothetical protein, partial [Endozoicomonas sp. ONNA2]|uniref:hypothetical protein n=1 Tax=Endozoicomonas sp. ONNA2 TaxID=2828741 RepID=UPI0021487FD4